MKKKILITICLLLGLSMITGCSDIEQAYLDDQIMIMEWPAAQDTSNIQFKLKFGQVDIDYALKLETQQEINQQAGDLKATINISGTSNNENYGDLPVVQMIYDRNKIYMKAQDVLRIVDAFNIKLSDKNLKALRDLKDGYFVYDSLAYQEDLLDSDPLLEEMTDMYQQIYADPVKFSRDLLLGFAGAMPDFSTPMFKADNRYILEINNNNAAPLIDSFVESIINNLEGIIKIYPFPESLKEEILAEVKTMDKELVLNEYREVAPEIKAVIDMGRFYFYMEGEYNPTDYLQKMELNMEYEPFFTLALSMNSVGKKGTDALNIKLPAEEKQVAVESFMEKLMTPEKRLSIDLESGTGLMQYHEAKPIEIQLNIQEYENMEMLPARGVLAALSEVVVWSDNMQISYVSTPDGPIFLEGEILNIEEEELLYISAWELMNLGYDVNWYGNLIIISK